MFKGLELNEMLAIRAAVELLGNECGAAWYSYANTEAGEPVYLKDLLARIQEEIEKRA